MLLQYIFDDISSLKSLFSRPVQTCLPFIGKVKGKWPVLKGPRILPRSEFILSDAGLISCSSGTVCVMKGRENSSEALLLGCMLWSLRDTYIALSHLLTYSLTSSFSPLAFSHLLYLLTHSLSSFAISFTCSRSVSLTHSLTSINSQRRSAEVTHCSLERLYELCFCLWFSLLS